MKKYVIIIPDGAADMDERDGGSPLKVARTPNLDYLAKNGLCGRVRNLYAELPMESMVAHLGILGWNPKIFYPGGRASSELLGACENIALGNRDIAFRANLATLRSGVLESYCAHGMTSSDALPLISALNSAMTASFPEMHLHHDSDFRNILVFKDASVQTAEFDCREPHECTGLLFDTSALVKARTPSGTAAVQRLNDYLFRASEFLKGYVSNVLLPWSPSRQFDLPRFVSPAGWGRAGIVGFMGFLQGIAKAADMEFYKIGDGRPTTDYRSKGLKVVELLSRDFSFVVCHINAPDEASHMGDREAKIASIENIDRHIIGPVRRFFGESRASLGGVLVLPDHFSNTYPHCATPKRLNKIHTADPVPFVLWNGTDTDSVPGFDERSVLMGRYGDTGLNHLDLLPLLAAHTPCSEGGKSPQSP